MSDDTQRTASDAERVQDDDAITAKVAFARSLRAEAGHETIRLDGSAVMHQLADPSRPQYAEMVQFEFTYFRWANETILRLLSDRVALVKRVEELEHKLACARASLVTQGDSNGRGITTLTNQVADRDARIEALTRDAARLDKLERTLDDSDELDHETTLWLDHEVPEGCAPLVAISGYWAGNSRGKSLREAIDDMDDDAARAALFSSSPDARASEPTTAGEQLTDSPESTGSRNTSISPMTLTNGADE